MAVDIKTMTFNELMPKFINIAEHWSWWSSYLSKHTVNPEEPDPLYTLKIIAESQDHWQLAITCAAYSIQEQKSTGSDSAKNITEILDILDQPYEMSEQRGELHKLATNICADRSTVVIQAAKNLSHALRDVPPLPPITLITADYCHETYNPDDDAIWQCILRGA